MHTQTNSINSKSKADLKTKLQALQNELLNLKIKLILLIFFSEYKYYKDGTNEKLISIYIR